MNARYYNPTLGRFISRDGVLGRVGAVVSRNGYVYVLNNPLKYTDPSGMEEQWWNNDYLQGTLGFAEGLNGAVWDTAESISNIFWHPLESVKGLAGSFTGLFSSGYVSAKNLYNQLRLDGWQGFSDDVKLELRQMGDNFDTLTPQQKGYFIGHLTEKAMEIAVMTKSGGTGGTSPQTATVAEFSYTQTAASHLTDVIKSGGYAGQLARPYLLSPLTIREIISTGSGTADVFLASATKYVVPGTFRGSTGMWELVIDHSTNLIYHFNFVK